MTQQLHVAGLPRSTEDGYFDTANANKSWVRVHGGQSSEFPIYPTTLERTIKQRRKTDMTSFTNIVRVTDTRFDGSLHMVRSRPLSAFRVECFLKKSGGCRNKWVGQGSASRFERSVGLDTALYKKLPLPLYYYLSGAQ